MGGIQEKYEMLWKLIIRPPRAQYEYGDLGPPVLEGDGRRIVRSDFTVTNKNGQKLECSHFEPEKRQCERLPCVIYLHGNSSCRLEGLKYVWDVVLKIRCTYFLFDFAGSGLSEGQYISLGVNEQEDIEAVVKHLRAKDTTSTIGLWGRSMGAISALMYSDRDPSISALVLDSPFKSLEAASERLVKQYVDSDLAFSVAFKLIRSKVKEKSGIELQEMNPLERVERAFIPAFFIHGTQDQLIPFEHSVELHKRYASEYKQIVLLEGAGHNDARPEDTIEGILCFLNQFLQVNELVPLDSPPKPRRVPEGEEEDLQRALQLSLLP